MKSKKSAKKNYIYNLLYHLLSLLTPLVVMPYISRVLGNYGVGQYAFAYSLITYFVLFASLGFELYAQREVARFQNDKKKQTAIFWEVLIARSLSTFFALGIHLTIALFGVYGEAYTLLMLILTINIVSVAFDISFLFRGNEDFGLLTLVTSVLKIAGIASILIFVNDESQLWLYTLLQSLVLIVPNILLWFFLPKYLVKVSVRELDIKRHIVPCLRLFIPTIAVSVYTVLDKTLIGVMVPGTVEVNGVEKSIADIENGNYEQAEKMVKMAMMIITSLGTVMIPKNSFALESGDREAFKTNIEKALYFSFFLGLPIMFGILSVSFNFAPWFFGPGYEKVPSLMMLFSPLVMIIGISNVIGLQFLLPLKKDKEYTIAIVSGAAINIVLNLILIPLFKSYGACVATLLAEVVVTGMMLFFSRKDLSFFRMISSSWRSIVAALTMFGCVFLTQFWLEPSIWNTLLLVCEGVLVYLIVLLVLREKTIAGLIRKRKTTNEQ